MKLLGHYVPLPIALLATAEFAVAAAALFLLGLLFPSLRGGAGLDHLWLWAVIFGVTVSIGLTAVGLYQAKQRLRFEGVLARVVVSLGIAAICVALTDLFFLSFDIPGLLCALSCAVCAVLLGVTRGILWRWVDHRAFQRRVVVYGAGERAASLLRLRRRSDQRGFNIVAFVPALGDKTTIQDPRVRPLVCPLSEFSAENEVDEIVIAMDDRREGFPIGDLLKCKLSGVAVVDLLTFLERETGKVKVDLMNPAWLIFSDGFQVAQRSRVATRVLDIAAAVVLLVAACWAMVIVAVLIVITDGRPVLYCQRRVGLMGRPFTLYKFRSMVKNAESDGTARWAQLGDARVTKVGAILRKLRLDELPQIFNVLRGHMSLVGPRPERPEFVERLSQVIPYYHERHVVKPGITGWAQLSYPYGSSDQDAMEKLQYDLYYIKHKSLIFDLMVLLQTAEVVLWGKGAR